MAIGYSCVGAAPAPAPLGAEIALGGQAERFGPDISDRPGVVF